MPPLPLGKERKHASSSGCTDGLYLALATDSNIPVDFIVRGIPLIGPRGFCVLTSRVCLPQDEDALEEPEVLGRYKLILLTEPDVPSAGMAGLLAWAESGGTLVAVSGAGSGDEYNTPSSALSAAAKVTEPPRKRLVFNGDDTIAAGTKGTTVLWGPFTAPAGTYSGLTPTATSVKTLGAYEDGTPAITRTNFGSGTGSIIRFGWLPGVAYWFSHAATTPPTPVGRDNSNGGNRPRSDDMRHIIADLAKISGVEPPVVASATHVETPLLLTPDKTAAVVTLLNFRPGIPVPPVSALKLNVTLPFLPTKAESVEHGKLTFTAKSDGEKHVVSLTVPELEFGDFIKFRT